MDSGPEFERLLQQSGSDDVSTRSSKARRKTSARSAQSGLKFSFTCLLISVTLLLFLLFFYTEQLPPLIDNIATHIGYNDRQYAIVIDAGSTGSRVLAYEFHNHYADQRLVLDRELFREVKPGLSAYAPKPELGAESIVDLLRTARDFVPAKLWQQTPVVLKATAGLRLLPAQQAAQLLAECRRVLVASGLRVLNDSAVEIMDGTDEGIFSWFTVNFLLGTLTGPNTVAALDLGGGSTQVTFVPLDPLRTPSHTAFMHSVPVRGGNVNVFTHSYLGLGLMAVRYAVFSIDAKEPGQTELSSDCVNPIVQGKRWTYANVEYAVSGKPSAKSTPAKPRVDFELCQQLIRSIMLPLVEPKPITLKQSQISAFSYYLERAVETGLIDLEGGDITVGDVMDKARDICTIPNTDQPFMCLDITYIALLLQDGFGLTPETKLKLYKKIDGHEISWALGCAYNLLTKQK